MPLERPERRWGRNRIVLVAVVVLAVAALGLGLVRLLGHSAPPNSAAPPGDTASQAAGTPPGAATTPEPGEAPGSPGASGEPGASGVPGASGEPGVSGAPGGEPDAPARAAQSCTAVAAALPLRARLAQRLMVGIDAAQPGVARKVVANYGVGGLFIGGKPTALLRSGAVASIKAASAVPLAVAVDEEGGRVQRINQIDGSMPSARSMAASMTPAQVRAEAARRGRDLRALGITVDLAPVADVSDEPNGGAIGDRSYSNDPKKVASYAGAFAAGLRDAGVLPVFKHFPGHGHGSGDSHDGTVTTPPLATLRGDDLLPYRQLLGAKPEAVMIGHLVVPGLTDGQPASLSPAAYRLLRTQYGFTGVTITDDLGAMKAITNSYDLPHAVLKSFTAGADMALWTSTSEVGAVLSTLQSAVRGGQLPEAGVTASVSRILAAKGACVP